MDQRSPARIVTGTDGSAAAIRGVSFAAVEADRRHAKLEVLHVMPAYVPTGPLPIIPDGAFQENARDVVAHAVNAARVAAPGVEVYSSILVGGRVSSLVQESADADLLVLGGRDATAAERVWTGATVTGVAARTSCPLFVIPPQYEQGAGPRTRIVAGVKSPMHAGPVLQAAFAEAARSKAHLTVVHSWQLAPGYDDIVADRRDREEWASEVGKELDDQLVLLRRAFPDVEATVEIVHGQAAHLLRALSRESDLLVISRPAHGGYVHHLGATARAVLRTAECPVLVVPPTWRLPAGQD